MSEEIAHHADLSRRSFLKTSAAVGSAAAIGTTSSMTALASADDSTDADEQVFSGACRGNCMGGCPLKLTVRGGKLAKVGPIDNSPWPEYARICHRGRSHPQTVYNEKRIKYPLRRVEGTARGAGEFERISWDEAIDEICTKWNSYREQYGPASIGISHSSGCYGMAFGVYLYKGYLARLGNLMNAVNIAHCYDSSWGKANMMTNLSCGDMPHYMAESHCLVVWDANPSESSLQAYHFISEGQEKGAKLIVIDPNFTITAAKADAWYPIRPGTDGALALTLFNMLVDRGYAREDIIRTYTTLPFLMKKEDNSMLYVSELRELAEGEADSEVVVGIDGTWGTVSEVAEIAYTGVTEVEGIKVTTEFDAIRALNAKWTPELCAEVCGFTVDQVEELFATLMANYPFNIVTGLGIDHYVNGYMSYVDIELFSLVSGAALDPAGGIGQYVLGGLDFWANMGASMPLGMSVSPGIPLNMVEEVASTGKLGKTDVPLKSIFIAYHNPLSNQTERDSFIRGMNKLDLVVVSDYIMSETAMYADIVLPCTHYFEQKDVFFLYSPFFTLQEQAIAPLYESKTNYEIIQLLGKGVGLGSYFSQTEDEVIEEVMDSAALQAFGITYDRVKKEKVISIQGFPGSTGLGMLSAEDKRANFYFAPGGRVANSGGYGGYFEYDQEIDWSVNTIPCWEPPHEAWSVTAGGYEMREIAKKYPLQYSSYRNKMRCHTQFGFNSWLLELFPEPTVMMNPVDMEPRGIIDGDYVRVYNDRGQAVVKAVENAGIHPRMIVMPKGWQADQYIKGHASSLTSRYMNPASSNNCFFDAMVEVEKYEGSVK